MPSTQENKQGTRILFDLNDILMPEEVERFKNAAEKAGAKSLTEHFLDITLRAPSGIPGILARYEPSTPTPNPEGLN